MNLTKAQRQRIARKVSRIRALSVEASEVFGDDPMAGDIYTALNNISSACDWIDETLNRTVNDG